MQLLSHRNFAFRKFGNWLIFFTFYFSLHLASGWILLKITRGPAPEFWDLTWILRYAECYKTYGDSVYLQTFKTNSCTGYIYGSSLLRLINFLRLDTNDTHTLGIFFIIILIFILSIIASKSRTDYFSSSLTAICFMSPGIWLLMASGNFDLLMLLIIFLAAYSAYQKWILLSTILISISVLVKFYTFPLFLIIYFQTSSRLKKISVIIVSVITAIFVIPDFLKTTGSPLYPRDYFFTFGLPSLHEWIRIAALKFELTLNSSYISSFLLGLLLTFCISLVIKSNLGDPIREGEDFSFEHNRLHKFLFLYFATVSIGLFVQGFNYDYKLTYYAIAFVSFFHLFNIRQSKFNISVILIGGTISLWFSCFSFGLRSVFVPKVEVSTIFVAVQMLGDFANYLLISSFLVGILKLFNSRFDSFKTSILKIRTRSGG